MDGVVTANGFFPTELNPRFGGAMFRIQMSVPELPLYFLHLCVVQQSPMTHYAKELEELLMRKVDENPLVKGMFIIQGRFDLGVKKSWITQQEGRWVFVDEAFPDACMATMGPHPTGSIIFINIHSALLRYGESGSEMFRTALLFLSEQWRFELPQLLSPADAEK